MLILSYYLVTIYVNFNIHASSIFPIRHEHIFRGEGDLFFSKTNHKEGKFSWEAQHFLRHSHTRAIRSDSIPFMAHSQYSKFFTVLNLTKAIFQLFIPAHNLEPSR